jgi:hypothetical protein
MFAHYQVEGLYQRHSLLVLVVGGDDGASGEGDGEGVGDPLLN